jgi:hypothetical protein
MLGFLRCSTWDASMHYVVPVLLLSKIKRKEENLQQHCVSIPKATLLGSWGGPSTNDDCGGFSRRLAHIIFDTSKVYTRHLTLTLSLSLSLSPFSICPSRLPHTKTFLSAPPTHKNFQQSLPPVITPKQNGLFLFFSLPTTLRFNPESHTPGVLGWSFYQRRLWGLQSSPSSCRF